MSALHLFRQLNSCINTCFPTEREIVGWMVKDIKRAAGEKNVRSKISVCENVDHQLFVVPDVQSPADHNQVFGEHHLSCSEKRVYHFHSLPWIALVDPYNNQIMGNASFRHVKIKYFWLNGQPDRWKEDLFGCFSQPCIFMRRNPYYGSRINCAFRVSNTGDMKNRIEVSEGVETRMIAKWPFWYKFFSRINIALNYYVGIWRNINVICNALYQLYFFLPEKSGQYVFTYVFWQWCSSGICVNRVSAQSNRYRHSFSCCLPCVKMICPCLVSLPVHSRGITSEYLHPVHSDIWPSGHRVNRMNHRKRDKPSSVVRPAFQDRQYWKIRF